MITFRTGKMHFLEHFWQFIDLRPMLIALICNYGDRSAVKSPWQDSCSLPSACARTPGVPTREARTGDLERSELTELHGFGLARPKS